MLTAAVVSETGDDVVEEELVVLDVKELDVVVEVVDVSSALVSELEHPLTRSTKANKGVNNFFITKFPYVHSS